MHMKVGMRTPSWKKSLSARTTGRAKRAIKKAIIPGYGQKGMGWLNPKKALYNRVYRQTTFSLFDQLKAGSVKKLQAVVDCPPEWTQEVLVESETVPLFIT